MTYRQKVMTLAKENDLSVDIEKNPWDRREIIRVEFTAPDGKGFDFGHRHTFCVPVDAKPDWEEIHEMLVDEIDCMDEIKI